MMVGRPAPKWAKDLEGKWIELDERHYGAGKIILFVMWCDDLGRDEEECVRVWPLVESQARAEAEGRKIEPGLSVTFIERDAYRIIDPPTGLEDWTAKNGLQTGLRPQSGD